MTTYTIANPNGTNWTYIDGSTNPNCIGTPVTVGDVWNVSTFGLNIAPHGNAGNGNITYFIWDSGGNAVWNSLSTDLGTPKAAPGLPLKNISVGKILTSGTYYFGFSRSNLSNMNWDNPNGTSGVSHEGDSVGGNLTRTGSGNSGRSLCGSFVYTVINAPGTPTSFSVTKGDKQVSLSWTAPTSDGGNAIAGYNIYRNTSGGAYSFLTNTTSTSYTNTSLSVNTTYGYYVNAYNSYKTSGNTSALTATTNNVPSAPGSFAGTATVSSIALSWTAPSDGGSTITGYTVKRGTTVILDNKDQLTVTESGLANNTSYTYTVYATNANGNSTTSSVTVTTLGGLVAVWSGSTWVKQLPKVKDSTPTAWVDGNARVWTGATGGWVYGK